MNNLVCYRISKSIQSGLSVLIFDLRDERQGETELKNLSNATMSPLGDSAVIIQLGEG